MFVETVDYQDVDVGEKFVRSLRETGFAVLSNHPLSSALLAKIYSGWGSFFKGDDKYDYVVAGLAKGSEGEGSSAGYVPADISETAVGHHVKDLKEFFHIFPGSDMPEALSGDTTTYLGSAFAIGETLLGWIEQELPEGVEKFCADPLDSVLSREDSLLRVLHYPPLVGNENTDAVRAAAHEDINLLTLLPVAEQPGLQVQDRAGNWHDVAGNQGDLIVNAGDMLSELTSGYFPSTTHRVVNPEGELVNVSRISIPYFLTPRLDVKLSERYTAGSYLAERLQEISR